MAGCDARRLSQSAQGLDRFGQGWQLLSAIDFAERDIALAVDHKDGAIDGAGVGAFAAKDSVGLAYFAVGPEVAAHWEIKWPEFALPFRSVHDGIDADRYNLGLGRDELVPLRLIFQKLLTAHRFPVRGIEREDDVLVGERVVQAKRFFHAAHQRG